jgi:hypothetical protein
MIRRRRQLVNVLNMHGEQSNAKEFGYKAGSTCHQHDNLEPNQAAN